MLFCETQRGFDGGGMVEQFLIVQRLDPTATMTRGKKGRDTHVVELRWLEHEG